MIIDGTGPGVTLSRTTVFIYFLKEKKKDRNRDSVRNINQSHVEIIRNNKLLSLFISTYACL